MTDEQTKNPLRKKTSMRLTESEIHCLDAAGSYLRRKHGGKFGRSDVIRWLLQRAATPPTTELGEVPAEFRRAQKRLQEES